MAALVTVEEMLSTLPKSERVMVDRLRDLVVECLPKASEKGYYGLGVPFYRHHRLICFIWPSSVVWGPVSENPKRKGVVSLGFCQGNKMLNDEGWLLAEGRKQVYVMYFSKVSEIDDNIVRSLLFEAGMIDDQFAQSKRKSNSVSRRRKP
jgi:hypothetical protein